MDLLLLTLKVLGGFVVAYALFVLLVNWVVGYLD